MKKRILSLLLVLAMAASLLVLPAAAEAYDSEYGWDEMTGDIAMRVTQDGGGRSTLIVGETYTLEFWIQNIAPYAVTVPLVWDPSVIKLVDPLTGAEVTSGKKDGRDVTGFQAGMYCYVNDYDPWTYEPMYWNGKPVYTQDTEEGYPYFDVEAGHARYMFYVSSPTAPMLPQLFLKISFQVIGRGDPDIHIGTWRDGFDRYDPASPVGLSVILREGVEGAEELSYGVDIPCPLLVAMTPEEYAEASRTPIGDIIASIPTTKPSTPSGGRPSGKPSVDVELVEAQHLTCFPYVSTVETTAVLKNINGKVTFNSDCILPVTLVSGIINDTGNSGKSSILVKMPEKIIEKNEYAIVFNPEIAADMAQHGLTMLYFETPQCYVGLNTAVIAGQCGSAKELRLSVSPYDKGLRLSMKMDGLTVKGLAGAALRIIFPYDGSKLTEGTIPVPMGMDVFGQGGSTSAQPMSLYRWDTEHGCIVFLAGSFCPYKIEQRSATAFADVPEEHWAVPFVNEISQRKIMVGTGDETFGLGELVTREQFATMLVRAFGMYSTLLEDGFADIAADSAYHPYTTSAKNAGLVNGTGDGNFGLGSSITREDLTVMAYRAACRLGVTFSSTSSTFADDADVSDYAKAAVYALYAEDIIGGVGNNAFAPKETATREQAAKILLGVLKAALNVL